MCDCLHLQAQRYVIDNYTTPDVELVTLINSSIGRDMYYNVRAQ